MEEKNPYKINTLSKYSTHNIIKENLSKDEIILDVGCNDGYIGSISDSSNAFYGLDYLEKSIIKAKNTYKDAIIFDLNKLEKLPWNIKFNKIIFADVLEHLLYPEKVLKFFIENYLEDNGIIIISLPNVANWQVRFNLLLGKFNYTETGILDKTHLHLYTFKTARELILKNNLKITKEFGGASFFGIIIKIFPFLKNILATNIILICKNE